MEFFARLERRSDEVDTVLCIGLDPAFSRAEIEARGKETCARIALESNLRIIESTHSSVAAYKPNIAFYEALGHAGMEVLRSTLSAIPEQIPVILDAKRGDISNTAEAYAQALFGDLGADAITVNPYLGFDTIEPYLSWMDRGVFVLCRTSNPGSHFMQDILMRGEPLYLEVARKALDIHKNIGLVVAGNDTEALRRVRQVTRDAWFLSPGIGVQGGEADQAFAYGARSDGKGILVVVARAIADSENPARTASELRDRMRKARDSRLKTISSSCASKASSTYKTLKEEFVDSLLSTGCFKLGEFVLKSGIMSPFYIDLRKLVADPEAMRIAGKAYAYLAAQCSNYDCIAGIPSAGLPLATAASLETGKPMIWPRMPLKQHGTGNKVEGIFSKNDRALLLDDLITTGASKIEAIEILRSEGLVVDDLIVLIERGEEGRIDMNSAGIRLHAFIHVKELFDILEQSGHISERQHKELVNFIENS